MINKPIPATNNLPANTGDKVPRIVRGPGIVTIKPLNERILLTTVEIAEQRMEKCKKCIAFEDWACKVSNNFMPVQTRKKAAVCPYGYWTSSWDAGKK